MKIQYPTNISRATQINYYFVVGNQRDELKMGKKINATSNSNEMDDTVSAPSV